MKYVSLFLGILALALSNDVEWNPSVDECPSYVDECNPIQLGYEGTAEEDADKIRETFSNPEIHINQVLMEVLPRRNLAQRLELAEAYKTKFNVSLIKELEGVITGRFYNLVTALLLPLDKFYAREIHKSIVKLFELRAGTLMEILGSLSNNGVKAVSNAYEKMYNNTSLRQVLDRKFSKQDYFGLFCMFLTMGDRNDNETIDENLVKMDINQLQKAEISGDEIVFVKFLFQRSFIHIMKVTDEINPLSNANRGISKSLQAAMFSLLHIGKNRKNYFVKRLHKALVDRLLPIHHILIRIVVGRSEIDLDSIIKNYDATHGKETFFRQLDKIRSISGSYKELLFRFLGKVPAAE